MTNSRHLCSEPRLLVDVGYGFFLGLALLLVCGCGSGRDGVYPVSGTVTFEDGTPLANGFVQFRPVNSSSRVSAHSKIEQDGSFQLSTYGENDGALAGQHQVIIGEPSLDPEKMDNPVYRRTRRNLVPEKYKSYAMSGLQFEVTSDPDQNHFEIELQRSEP